MTRLHIADISNLEELVEMSIKFHQSSTYSHLKYDKQKLRDTLITLINDKQSSLVLTTLDTEGKPVGMLIFKVQSLPFSYETVAAEIAWWMEPEARNSRQSLEMFKAGEYWARKVGANYIQYSSLSSSDENVDKFYLRQGYTMTEKAFLKELK